MVTTMQATAIRSAQTRTVRSLSILKIGRIRRLLIVPGNDISRGRADGRFGLAFFGLGCGIGFFFVAAGACWATGLIVLAVLDLRWCLPGAKLSTATARCRTLGRLKLLKFLSISKNQQGLV